MSNRQVVLGIGLIIGIIVVGWLIWAWVGGGFCTAPPGSACA